MAREEERSQNYGVLLWGPRNVLERLYLVSGIRAPNSETAVEKSFEQEIKGRGKIEELKLRTKYKYKCDFWWL